MRSYYAHLQTFDKTRPIIQRSSAIFPAFQDSQVFTRLIFLNYWMLKRHLSDLKAKVTVRNAEGILFKEKELTINEPKAYEVLLSDYISPNSTFIGSLEIEFFSTVDLVFPYPAVAVNYFGPSFSTVVHTAQRVYNDEDDELRNSETHVPESGFNLYVQEGWEPFFSMINGPLATSKQELRAEFFNREGEQKVVHFPLESLPPYATTTFYPAQRFDLAAFLKGEPGTCKIDFRLNKIFPRLIAGNRSEQLPALSITHTYYDLASAAASSDYWSPSDDAWHAASLMIPLEGGKHFTSIDLYPIYSPSPFTLDLEIYNAEGALLKRIESFCTVAESFKKFLNIRLDPLYPSEEPLAARLIARSLSQKPIPARIKLAVDIGVKGKGLPCNICTSLQPYVPAFSEKKQSFKWAPLLADQPQAFAYLMHSSPAKELNEPAYVELKFYRQADSSVFERKLTITPQGFHKIDPTRDSELLEFFQDKVGWFTANTTNPYMTLYYFAENPTGVVGGDHGF